MSKAITVILEDETIQSYLDHYGNEVGREIKLEDLTEEELAGVLGSLGDEMKFEIEMRCDDHSGFETDQYFYGVFGD